MVKQQNILKYMVCGLMVITVISCQSRSEESSEFQDFLEYIDPTIGNVAPLLNPNRPMVHLPNQMVRMFPKRYDHLDMQITDFPLLALNMITPQMIFGIKPSKGQITDSTWYRRLTYDHDFEIIKPYYYSTNLTDDTIFTEYTPGEKTGIYRFTFPEGVQKNLLMSHYYENGLYEIKNGNTIVGTEFVLDQIHDQKGTAYMYGEFSGNPKFEKSQGELDWGKYSVGTWGGVKPKKMDGERAWVSYSPNDPSVVEFRYAISFISQEQAKNNFNELEGMTFEGLKEKGKAAWGKVINQIKVEGGTESQRRSFYTALYRCYARMVDITEDGSYFSGYDKSVHLDDRSFYVDDYTWGNYLALHPLRLILNPSMQADILESYVRMYEQEGWMPEYPKHFGDRPGMFGFKSSVVFLDAYRKGVRNFNVEKAFEGLLNNAENATMLPFRNGPKGGLEDFYNENGFYPGLHPGMVETDSFASLKKGQKRSSVAITLGDAYDSWALSELAKELNKTDVAAKFAPKKLNYKNLWNAEYNLFMPKDEKGNWIDIDPKFDGGHHGFDYYNENNAWSYMWNVQQDIKGLTELMGGINNFEQNLDQLFRESLDRGKPEFFEKFSNQTGMIGQFAMGNQVTFFIPYLFNYTDSPWKTQKYTRLILDTWFQDNIFGVPGDEDGGSMSAFVVFSAMGFFPVTPGIPSYSITSPVFTKVTIDLPNNKTFTLIANNSSRKNKYIQSAFLNGKELKSLTFSHEDLMNGGTLELEMGEETNKIWELKY